MCYHSVYYSRVLLCTRWFSIRVWGIKFPDRTIAVSCHSSSVWFLVNLLLPLCSYFVQTVVDFKCKTFQFYEDTPLKTSWFRLLLWLNPKFQRFLPSEYRSNSRSCTKYCFRTSLGRVSSLAFWKTCKTSGVLILVATSSSFIRCGFLKNVIQSCFSESGRPLSGAFMIEYWKSSRPGMYLWGRPWVSVWSCSSTL